MFNREQNIRIINFDTFVVLVILILGLFIYNNTVKNTNELKSKPVSTYMSVGEKIAINSTCIRLNIFQKAWILNKDHYNVLAFNRSTLSEDKKTGIKVFNLKIIRLNSHNIPQFILMCHQFPEETDEPPLLG